MLCRITEICPDENSGYCFPREPAQIKSPTANAIEENGINKKKMAIWRRIGQTIKSLWNTKRWLMIFTRFFTQATFYYQYILCTWGEREFSTPTRNSSMISNLRLNVTSWNIMNYWKCQMGRNNIETSFWINYVIFTLCIGWNIPRLEGQL